MRDALADLVTGGSCLGCQQPGRLLCATCEQGLPRMARTTRPVPCPPGLAPAAVAGDYEGLVRALVLNHKEHRSLSLARPLGDLLALAVSALLWGQEPEVYLVLVPVPSRLAVVAHRGHDPLLRVVRRAALVLERDHDRPCRVRRLLRQADRPRDQAGLGAKERLANLAGTMATRTGQLRALAVGGMPCRFLVCDDVLTTGATAREAQRALEAVGLPVSGIACVAGTVRRLPISPARD